MSLGGWLAVLPGSASAGIYRKKDAILASLCLCFPVDLLDDFRDKFPLRSALERLLFKLVLFIITSIIIIVTVISIVIIVSIIIIIILIVIITMRHVQSIVK